MSSKNRNQRQRLNTNITGATTMTAETLLEEEQLIQDSNDTTVEETSSTEYTALEASITESKPVEVINTNAEQLKISETKTQKGFNPVYKVELELTGYADAMDKKNVMVPEQGGKWQYSLFKAIKSCFNATSQDIFNAEFNTIINFFHKNKDGIFNEKFIFRFPENWPGSQNEYTQNRRLVYLIIQSADPKTRKKVLEQINMELVAEGMTEAQKQMLFNYYQL